MRKEALSKQDFYSVAAPCAVGRPEECLVQNESAGQCLIRGCKTFKRFSLLIRRVTKFAMESAWTHSPDAFGLSPDEKCFRNFQNPQKSCQKSSSLHRAFDDMSDACKII